MKNRRGSSGGRRSAAARATTVDSSRCLGCLFGEHGSARRVRVDSARLTHPRRRWRSTSTPRLRVDIGAGRQRSREPRKCSPEHRLGVVGVPCPLDGSPRLAFAETHVSEGAERPFTRLGRARPIERAAGRAVAAPKHDAWRLAGEIASIKIDGSGLVQQAEASASATHAQFEEERHRCHVGPACAVASLEQTHVGREARYRRDQAVFVGVRSSPRDTGRQQNPSRWSEQGTVGRRGITGVFHASELAQTTLGALSGWTKSSRRRSPTTFEVTP